VCVFVCVVVCVFVCVVICVFVCVVFCVFVCVVICVCLWVQCSSSCHEGYTIDPMEGSLSSGEHVVINVYLHGTYIAVICMFGIRHGNTMSDFIKKVDISDDDWDSGYSKWTDPVTCIESSKIWGHFLPVTKLI